MNITIGPNEKGQSIDKFLKKWLKDVPLSAIFRAIRKGDIRVNGKKIKDKYILEDGDAIEAKYIKSENKKEFIRIDQKLKITYEDDNILVVEKKPGILVHKGEKIEETLTDQVLSYLFDKGDYQPEKEATFSPSPCNRLDRNTSGLVIFAKNYQALINLNQMIRDRKIEKYYMALIKGKLKDGLYEGYIKKDERINKSVVIKEEEEGAKNISMNIKTETTCGSFSLIEIELMTGRSHQIRAHLNSLGHAIIGDPKYGDKEINNYFNNKYSLEYQYLYAYKLIFRDCPDYLSYLNNETILESIPPIYKRIKKEVFKF
ncbi:MAG: RluA family pseudouridine synthase [Clostridiaceae bacterium]